MDNTSEMKSQLLNVSDENLLFLLVFCFKGTLRNDDGILVKMCNLVKHWDSLSLTEQENLNQTFQMGCNCTVMTVTSTKML